MPDPELESLKRSIDLVAYARSRGYRELPRDGVPGIVVLEHERLGDRVAVARYAPGGIYARIPEYQPRAPEEPEKTAGLRLRDCIENSKNTGRIVEFVQTHERAAGRPEPSIDQVREHLRAWKDVHRGLERASATPAVDPSKRIGDWTPSPASPAPGAAEVQERLARWREAQRTIDQKLGRGPSLDPSAGPARDSPAATRDPARVGREAPLSPEKAALGKRQYDWSPPGQGASKAVARVHRPIGPDRGR